LIEQRTILTLALTPSLLGLGLGVQVLGLEGCGLDSKSGCT